MTRALSALFICFCLLFAGMPATRAQERDADTQEILKKLEELSKRLDTLERNLMNRINALDRKPEPAKPQSPLEAEAQEELGRIRRLTDAGQFDEAKTRMTAFLEKYGQTDTAKIARRVNEEVLSVVGKPGPADWGIEKWFQGESEADLNGDKPTLVVFWEAWCPHCKREVPKLEAVYEALKGEGLHVVGLTRITKSATEESVQKFITDNHITYPIAKEDGKAGDYFGVRGIPAAAFLKGGKVIWRGHPGALDEEMIKGWL